MKKITVKKSVIISLSALSLMASMPLAVYAQNTRAEEARQTAEERHQEVEQNIAERKEAAQARLTEAKLKACQNRQQAITNIMTRIAERTQRQTELFSTIAERTQTFYEEKGNTLSNYDELVADVEEKKAAAEAVATDIASTGETFDCEGDNPRGAIDSFKESLKAKIQALKEYRTSVKNLIVGVKSVQPTDETTESGDGGSEE